MTSAGKWQAGITAFLGAYATVGFIVGPATLAGIPSLAWKLFIVIILGLAGVCGLKAVWFAYRAAYGWPRVVEGAALTGPKMAEIELLGAEKSRAWLDKAKRWAGIGGLFAIVGSYWSLLAGLVASAPAPHAVVVTPTAAYCGTLQTTNGVTSVLVAKGKQFPVADGTMTIVSSCGGT